MMSDRLTPYQHSSGFQKRKLAQKKSADAQALMSKIPKLTDMFRKQQCQSDRGIAEAAGTETTSDMEASVHGVHPEPEANHVTGANVGTVSATTSRTNEQG